MNLQDIRSALQSTDEETRRSALSFLHDIPNRDAQDILFVAMGDESWRVRKEAVERYVVTGPDSHSIEQLLELLRNEDNAGLRNSAAETIIRLGSASVSPLLVMLKDQDPDVRKFVIDVMGAIGAPAFVPALLNSLGDKEVNVASAAAEQLGAIGETSASEQLMSAILNRDEVLFRFSALGALGTLAKPVPVTNALLTLADQDILRKAVFDCLGAISDESSFRLLLDGFSCHQKNCRVAAVKALYKIYWRSAAAAKTVMCEAIQLLKENEIISGLIELFDERDALLTEALVWISVVTRDHRFIPLLIEAYANERSAALALSALKSFGREALNEIVSRYAILEDSGRSGLCILIAECGYSGFNDVIQKALHDTSPQVRKAAAIAVGKLGLITAINELITLIDDREPRVYSAAVSSLQSLVMISRSAIIAAVDHFYASKEAHHRTAAALLLVSLGDLDRLLLLLKDENPHVRKAAISALGNIRTEKSGSMLLLALADEDPDVRIAVAEALGNLHDELTLDALENALDDRDIWVQSALLKAVACIDQSRALAIIKNIHTRSDGLLLITCLQIVEQIGGAEAETIIRDALKNNDPDIVRQAGKSLDHITTT